MQTGEELRDIGMKRAYDNAQKNEPTWGEQALESVLRFPCDEFMTEDVREWAYNNGVPEPPNERAWGIVMREAAKSGFIRRIGYRMVTNPKAHKTPAALWLRIV